MSSSIKIKNRHGVELHASIEMPANSTPQQFAIVAHCFTCNSNFAAVRNIGRELTNHGFGVVRFDFTGLGQSEGEFAESTFSANISDLEDVSRFLEKKYKAPTLLIGHSLGGAAVLVAAARLKNIKAVATIGAPAEAVHVAQHLEPKIEEIKENGEAEVNIGGRPFRVKKKFLDDLERANVMKNVKDLRKPLLIFHSPQDKIVNIENARKLYEAAFHPKSFVSLDGADHLLNDKKDSTYVASVIGTWVARYLEHPVKEKLNVEDEQVAAHLVAENGFTTQISNDRNTLIADEPKSAGGADLGFSPYELVNAALGACTAMTLKMYADRKKWPLEEAFVYLSHSKRHADDIDTENEQCEKLDRIDRKVKLVGSLDDSQRKKLLEIADKCPVHKTLTQGIKVVTEVKN